MTSYRIHGITDETDTCEVCGKIDLRRVVMLAALDADGNTEEIIYAGTTCAARKLAQQGTRVRASRIADSAAAAERVMIQAREWATEFSTVSLNQYIAANAAGYLSRTGGDVTAALVEAKRGYGEMLAEITSIKAGCLTGTRWEKELPVL